MINRDIQQAINEYKAKQIEASNIATKLMCKRMIEALSKKLYI